jgi:hypothetical protein
MDTAPPQMPDVLAPQRRRRVGCLFGSLGLVFAFGMLAALVAALMAIWPGSLKWTSRFVCPNGYDDTFIVRDTYNVQPGETSTTFTMYCMSPRGEVHDAGIFTPMVYQFAALAVALVLVVGLVLLVLRARRPSAIS